MQIPNRAATPTPISALLLALLASAGCSPGLHGPDHSGPALSADGLDAVPARMLNECGRLAGDAKEHCYERNLIDIVHAEGVGPAMEALEQIAERDPAARHLGHVFAHHIGLAGYRPDAPVDEVFLSCTPAFQSGCYHGVVQAFFAEIQAGDPAGDLTADRLDALCGSHRGPDGDPWLLFQCVHGVGHGLIAVHHGHLPDALAGCDLLPTEWEREGCYGGAFMEVVVSATMPHHGHAALTGADGGDAPLPHDHAHHHGETADHHEHAHHDHHHGEDDHHVHDGAHHDHAGGDGDHAHHEHGEHLTGAGAASEPFPPLDPADPHHPCSALPDRYLGACYSMQTSAVLFWNDGDFRSGVRFCEEAPGPYRHLCFSSLGRDISAYTAQDPAAAIDGCAATPAEYRQWCYSGVAKHFVDLTADPADALAFCARVPEDEPRLHCFQAVGQQIALLTPDPQRRRELCTAPDAATLRACILGADLPDPASRSPAP